MMRTPWKILEKWRAPGRAAVHPSRADGAALAATATTTVRGQAAEDAALHYLQQQGLRLLARNFRTPGRGGGEIDLLMQERDGTVVFVEVRSRSSSAFGGAGSSIGAIKQQRVVFAARHYLLRYASPPPCRLGAVVVEGQVQWFMVSFVAQ